MGGDGGGGVRRPAEVGRDPCGASCGPAGSTSKDSLVVIDLACMLLTHENISRKCISHPPAQSYKSYLENQITAMREQICSHYTRHFLMTIDASDSGADNANVALAVIAACSRALCPLSRRFVPRCPECQTSTALMELCPGELVNVHLFTAQVYSPRIESLTSNPQPSIPG